MDVVLNIGVILESQRKLKIAPLAIRLGNFANRVHHTRFANLNLSIT